MQILWKNLLDFGTVSATNANASYPVSNLTYATQRSRTLLALFKATASASTITATFADTQTIDGFAVGNHNITALTLTLKDPGGVTIGTESFTSADLSTAYSFTRIVNLSTSYTGVKTAEFALTTTESTAFIGGLYIGTVLTLAPANAFQPVTYRLLGNAEVTDQGVLSGRPGTSLAACSWPMVGVTRAILDEYIEAYTYCQNNRPMFIDPHPGQGFRQWFGRITNDSVEAEVYEGGDYSVSISFEEVR